MQSLQTNSSSLLADGVIANDGTCAASRTNSTRPMSRAMQLREAALLVFCEPAPAECASLAHLSAREWKQLLHWLDTSGLALYFLDRLSELNISNVLPPHVLQRLNKNVSDNTERIEEMISESVAIQAAFQEAGLSYAVLKGFSLWPVSVPRLELRSQLDLDFLIAREHADRAREILEATGYRLRASDGRNLDFSADEGRTRSLMTMYEAGRIRSAELHIESVPPGQASLLSRTETVTFRNFRMQVLPPHDLLLGQGLHLYKHVCSQFVRAAHLLEFRRHVVARHDDSDFWHELQDRFSTQPYVCLRLGVVVLLITRVMGKFAPQQLTCWTVDELPAAARLWIGHYGRQIALAAFPGTKLYLLLEQELEAAGLPARHSIRDALLPRRLPQPVVHAVPGESLRSRLDRHLRQFQFNCFRLRFSVLEGIRFFRESARWKRMRSRVTQ
jgi:hypothetical protein